MSSVLTSNREAVDPGEVPKRRLYTGAFMPGIGLGTFGSDHVAAEEIAEAVRGAAEVGYRHFDCASVYSNEDRIGFALRDIMAERHPARRAVGHLQALERQARRKRRDPVVREVASRPAARIPGPVPDPLAVPEFPPARLRRRVAQPRRQALHPREFHEDLAADGRSWWIGGWCGTSGRRT